MLFSDQRKHKIQIPRTNSQGNPFTINDLLHHLCETLMTVKDKKNFFMIDDTVSVCPLLLERIADSLRRPGILVLINDTDWEIEGEGRYEIADGDEIVFCSTLHGG